MEIMATYQHTETGRWYVRARLTGGREVEFKFVDRPGEREITAAVEQYEALLAAAERPPEPVVRVEAEDGTII